ncbi:LysR substrate-binding domain-containing protein [uncultured Ruegeria sp.]|uniref:LysR substrate-binding domain-containing protein n=1 Tax=uncultured Ruegeria sp. TaxID=259304 RepID=UPI002606CAB7|nr:LysR substrate-binding domain-containing protein [uncultured Ruegeria sp.]
MRLPPLNALKAFEATVRQGGFTQAASELGVSPAAVSMQVKNAEEYLGKKLFRRLNNRLLMTDAGRMYYPVISEALTAISSATENLMEIEARSRITVSTIQSLAENRVAPAMARLRARFPDTGIDLRIEADPVNLRDTRTDLRITSENHLYPQHEHIPLFKDTAYPFCMKDFFERHISGSGMENVSDHLLIHTDWGEQYASHPTWANWFRNAQIVRRPSVRKGLRVGGAVIACALAEQGVGVALVPRTLIDARITDVRRFHIGDPGLPLPYSYYAVLAEPDAKRRSILRAFIDELVASSLTDNVDIS